MPPVPPPSRVSNLARSPQKDNVIKDKAGNEVLFDDNDVEAVTGTQRYYGDVVHSKEGERIHDFFWDGVKPPWGCLWCGMWRHNVRALHDCKQQAVVIYQCDKTAKPADGEWAENDKPEWGVHMGLGNAQQGEVAWMREEGIPVYAYTVDEYAELVALAEAKAKVPRLAEQGLQHVAALPSDTLAPEPEPRENVLTFESRGPPPGCDRRHDD